MWIDRWAVSYPVVQMSEASANGSTEAWQSALQTAFERIQGRHIAVVAHGAGAGRILGVAVPRRHPDAEETRRYHSRISASRYFSRRCGTHFPTRPLSLPCRIGGVRTRRRAARLGAKTGGFVERPPVGFPAFGQFERYARRLAVGYEADAGNVAGVNGRFIGISVNRGCKENTV